MNVWCLEEENERLSGLLLLLYIYQSGTERTFTL